MLHLAKGFSVTFSKLRHFLLTFSLNSEGKDMKTIEMVLFLHFQVV